MARTHRDPHARERILDAAREAVAAHGVHAASMRTIAAQAGVTTGYVTHYFDDKQELMVALLDHTNAQALQRLAAATSHGSPHARLRAAVETLLPLDAARRREWQVWVACWVSTSPGEPLAKGMRGAWRGLRDVLATLIEETDARADARYEAQRLVTTIAGIGLLAGVDKPADVRAQALRMLDDQLGALV